MFEKLLKKSEQGQAIILIAFAMVGLIAIVGLMTDGGILLIEYAKLKRAIDSASIASALQFRRGFTGADLTTAAQEFLILNQSAADNIQVYTCNPDNEINTLHDPELCTVPLRKLIRINATRTIGFGFLRVIGINGTTITASSVGEAASLDLVLVIDTSASMAYETTGGFSNSDPGDDPAICNNTVPPSCKPMESVKAVALDFMDTMFFPYDRVAIVTMTSQNENGFRDPFTLLQLSADETAVRTAIGNIRVYQPPSCPSVYGTCRDLCTQAEIDAATDSSNPCYNKPVDYYVGEDCPAFRIYGDRSSCTSSNVGGALEMAGAEFGREPVREDSFWVVIALVGGPANASTGTGNLTDGDGDGYPDDPAAFGFCPYNTWSGVNPPCRDSLESTRHSAGDIDGTGNSIYDADDYARDRADFLADPVNGMGVTVFTIGMGTAGSGLLVNTEKSDPVYAGELLLQYIAEEAGDSPPSVTANHGFYAFSPETSDLASIFSRIAENIFTRLSQ